MNNLFLKKVAIFSTLVLFVSCTGKEPSKSQFIGIWTTINRAELNLGVDGTFNIKKFPAELVFIPHEEYKGAYFSGSGNWTLRKGETGWEIYLDFKKVSKKKYLCEFPMLISGHGVFENKAPWYIFLWKGEEGGERYIFFKK